MPSSSSLSFSTTTMRVSSSSTSSSDASNEGSVSPIQYLPMLRPRPARPFNLMKAAMDVFRSLFPGLHTFVFPSCHWPPLPIVPARVTPASPRRRRTVAGTFFGHKKGRVSFAVQVDSQPEPVLLLELPMLTCDLVREMASGTVRILLECDRVTTSAAADKIDKKRNPLWEESLWTIYCNGHRQGYAVARRCNGFDLYLLSMVRAVSVGAGVLPAPPPLPPAHPMEMGRGSCKKKDGEHLCDDASGNGGGSGEVMYMRARYERVVGSKDSEAFYLMNPDSARRKGNDIISGGPELCIFLLRM
ncbi:hypothetical protein Cni_G19005 [Canna indica]|uniref:Protein MIZU-KUSSEI 1 n=1 Tax=Canna indica TaxID=4628 RepID=A0AAQ3QEY3_9LILI|nr:hypothetical protein Cni_G19005 [Canna indica]